MQMRNNIVSFWIPSVALYIVNSSLKNEQKYPQTWTSTAVVFDRSPFNLLSEGCYSKGEDTQLYFCCPVPWEMESEL